MWPEVVTTFEKFLQREGLQLHIRREEPDAFGNKLVEYRSRDINVQIVCDRSVWSVLISHPVADSEDWYDAQLIRDLLAGTQESSMVLDEKLRFLESTWPEITRRFSALEWKGSEQQLKTLRFNRARRRWPNWFRNK